MVKMVQSASKVPVYFYNLRRRNINFPCVGPNIFGIGACSVHLNGKLVQEPEEGEMVRTITASWAEFAKEEIGNYPTLDDAVKLHRLLEDIKRSEIEGRRVYVQ